LHIRSIAGGLAAVLIVGVPDAAGAAEGQGSARVAAGPSSIILPMLDPDRGRRLFVAKG
jgi:hypothetical protein